MLFKSILWELKQIENVKCKIEEKDLYVKIASFGVFVFHLEFIIQQVGNISYKFLKLILVVKFMWLLPHTLTRSLFTANVLQNKCLTR